MTTTVRGIYREGKVELTESPGEVRDESEVIVTFVDPDRSTPSGIDLRALGIDRAEAARMRAAVAAFAEDWDDPEMDIYDDYDNARAQNG